MKLKCYLLIIPILAWFSLVQAAPQSPLPTLEATANYIIKDLQTHKGNLQDNPGYVYHLIEDNLLPLVDVEGMSRSVVGGQKWKEASAAERQGFKNEFTRLIIRTYSAPLTTYTNETVRFQPTRDQQANGDFMTVRSVIIRNEASNIRLDYSLVRKGDNWKVFDIVVEGVSLLQSYRSQFEPTLSGSSLARLTEILAENNQKAAR